MKITVKENETYSEIKEYSIKNASIGYYGYITKGFQNVKEIMPANYKELPFTSIVRNFMVRQNVKIESPAISIVNSWYENFYHFIYESLVKLFCLRGHLNSASIVFPSFRYKFHDEWIELLGLDNLTFINKRQAVKTPLAISCNYLNDSMESKKEILSGFRDWVLSIMKKKGLLFDKNKFPAKIFINRTKARYRKILNSDEVLLLVSENGYTSIDLEDFSLPEQINYFYHAEDIIGVHGAGYSHIGFTKAPVLDIIVDNFYSDWFSKLAKNLGISYEFMRTRGVENNFHIKTPGYHDMIIDIPRLKEQLIKRNLLFLK